MEQETTNPANVEVDMIPVDPHAGSEEVLETVLEATAETREKIAVGVSTVTGLAASAATAAVPLIQWISDQAPANTQLLWLSGAILLMTQLGRYGQSIAAALRSGRVPGTFTS